MTAFLAGLYVGILAALAFVAWLRNLELREARREQDALVEQIMARVREAKQMQASVEQAARYLAPKLRAQHHARNN